MGLLKVGDTVKMKYGGEAKVLAEFGSGGQGTVYKVSYNGKEYALKWYHKDVFKTRQKIFIIISKTTFRRGHLQKIFCGLLE
mgnify:CR=1 FL=1